MDIGGGQDVIRELSDLELAALVCLVADQHCIITTPEKLLDDLEAEVQLSAVNTFALTCATVVCSPSITTDDFSEAVVVENDSSAGDESPQSFRKASIVAFSTGADGTQPSNSLDGRKVANVVIAKNLDQASHLVQVQALEVDHLFISHHHSISDGLPRLNASQASEAASISSQSSVVRYPPAFTGATAPYRNPVISEKTLAQLQNASNNVRTTAEIRRYIHNIVTFLRLHRAVSGGISALSSRHFSLLTRILPPLHGLNYTTPSHIALAARKIFPHRIVLATPFTERSLQWGSSAEAIAQALRGVTAEGVIEDILGEVECPL